MITWHISVDGVEYANYNFSEKIHEDEVIRRAVSNPIIQCQLKGRQHVSNQISSIGPNRNLIEIKTLPENSPQFLAE